MVKGQKLEIYTEMSQPLITAYVVGGKQNLAIRTWELDEVGIRVTCNCEKQWFCPAQGRLLRPEPPDQIEAQLWGEIVALRQEYGVRPDAASIYRVVREQPQRERKLMLFGKWKDKAFIAQAQESFERHE